MPAALDPLEACGDFPPLLFRAFDEERWARAFVERGQMRFSRTGYFAAIEDSARADFTEGKAHLQILRPVTTVGFDRGSDVTPVGEEPGVVHWHSEILNPVYILCFSYPPDGDLSRLPMAFGKHIVRVNEPRQLAQDITDWLTKEGALRGTPVVECHRVRYDKGELGTDEPDHFTRTRLNFTQKPASYSHEFEYRFAVVASPEINAAPFGTHHFVDLGGPLRYAEILPSAV